MVKDHSKSEFFYMHHPTNRIAHTTGFVTPVVEHWLEWEITMAGDLGMSLSKHWVTATHTSWMTDWLTDWLSDWLTDWLTEWLTDWLTDWVTDWLSDWVTEWLTDWLTDWLTEWMNEWLFNDTIPLEVLPPLVEVELFVLVDVGRLQCLLDVHDLVTLPVQFVHHLLGTLSNNNKQFKWNVLFNDALNTFYLQLYGVGHMVKDNSDSERGKKPAATT